MPGWLCQGLLKNEDKKIKKEQRKLVDPKAQTKRSFVLVLPAGPCGAGRPARAAALRPRAGGEAEAALPPGSEAGRCRPGGRAARPRGRPQRAGLVDLGI